LSTKDIQAHVDAAPVRERQKLSIKCLGSIVDRANGAELYFAVVPAVVRTAWSNAANICVAYAEPPDSIDIDLDATDDPLHGHQEGRFFHGYYDCYCYLPLYIFCGRHLLAAELRRANIDASAGAVAEIERIVAQIRARWPHTRIRLSADSGFAREELMAWCEENGVDYIFGLARNNRLVAKIGRELKGAQREASRTGRAARRFKDFQWTTLDSWSRRRRVIGKAEWTRGEANPRFIVTSLKRNEIEGRALYEDIYCARPPPLARRTRWRGSSRR
jgi:hypothetical protein